MNVPLFKIYNDNLDTEYLTREIKSGKFWAVGENVEKFESEIASYLGSEYALVLNSGTSALHALLLAYEIGPGDEVIVPSFTFIATANAPLFVGAKPVFADIEEETFGLDPKDVEEKITDKTKAIITVHYGGCPSKVFELKKIAKKYDLILIEDAAESFGASVNGVPTGTIGDSGILSFCQNKVITTGEGGAIVTNDKEIYEKVKLIRSHGRAESGDYFSQESMFEYVTLGYNWRMSNLTATLGLSQIEKADKIINLRRRQAHYYNEKLKEVEEIKTFTPPEGYNHVYQLYSVLAPKRDELIDFLGKSGVSSKIYFNPVHLSPFYRETLKYSVELHVTESVSSKTITLPMFPDISNEEIDYVVSAIKKFYKGV